MGSIYRYEKGIAPFKYAVSGQVFLTSKLIQNHWVRLDVRESFGLPLRLVVGAQYTATLTDNYCGLGASSRCTPAPGAGPVDRHWAQSRYVNPALVFRGDWRLAQVPQKLRLFFNWGGSYFQAGAPGDMTPYPGSLYALERGTRDDGFLSTAQVGLLLDGRDNEPAPTRGFWAEASGRFSAPWIGATHTFAGVNAAVRGFVPLLRSGALVSATRVVFDGLFGAPPAFEQANTGGFSSNRALGGQYTGRGIRSVRYQGMVKAFAQTELRWSFWSFRLLGVPFGLTGIAFFDVGAVAADWRVAATELRQLRWGTGGGLRVAWDSNFIIRLDVGVSPVEGYSPAMYLSLENIF